MINLFGEEVSDFPKTKKQINKQKRNWENRFQRWSDNVAFPKANKTDALGVCGYGEICNCCEDNSCGRPCVRALNLYLKENHKTINYEDAGFEEVWTGEYWEAS